METLVPHQAPGGGGQPQHGDEGVLGVAVSIRVLVLKEVSSARLNDAMVPRLVISS